MKKVILASLLAATASSAIAAETTTLKVKGTLTTSACVPNMSNGGTVDFGNIALGGLSATEINQLGSKNLTLTISCDSPTKVGFTSIDDRTDSTEIQRVDFADGTRLDNGAYAFGLGKTAGDVKIGNYITKVLFDQATADGSAAQIIYQQTGTGSTAYTLVDGVGSGKYLQVENIRTTTVGNELSPIAFTTAVFPLEVAASIQPTDILAITDDTELDGQTTISLVYL